LDLAAVTQFLPGLASGYEKELDQIHGTLFAAHGPRPLHKDLVGERLRREVYAVRRSDLTPASDALHQATRASGQLANELRLAVATAGRGTCLDELALPPVEQLS